MLFSLLYNLCLMLFALIALPKLLWQRFMLGKYRESLGARLGYILPAFSAKEGQEVIWIHAVSLGETRAMIPLFRLIRETHPKAAIVISTTTETGHTEAKRCMPEADAHFFLPLDFSWIMRRILAKIQPTTLILCESDFWYHLLKIAKKMGARIALVNGKVSERSARRFKALSLFSRQLFAHFDVLCMQSQRYLERFHLIGIPLEKIHVTGNLKFDAPASKMEQNELQTLKAKLGIQPTDRVVVVGSTHAQEEDWILNALIPLWKKIPELKVLIVPRHPERFNEVAHLFQEKVLSFRRFSERKKGEYPLILIDAMGILNQCFQIADLAIIGGSFVSHVGGHNIFEPVLYNVPVLFGPHMQSQPDLTELILAAGAGKQVPIEKLTATVLEFLQDSALHRQHSEACRHLTNSVHGSTKRTFEYIFPKYEKDVVV